MESAQENPFDDINQINAQGGLGSNITASSMAGNNYTFDNALKALENKARAGDTSAIEKLFNYYSTKKSEETARELTMKREDNQYQRLVEDLRKAGISPYVISSASPGVSAFTGATYSGSQMTSEANARRTGDINVGKAILTAIGTALLIALKIGIF